jgi:3D (Asp-Asp-Asp) domain-containing protein/peptidoglycan hydrolase CwlO-like protein
VSRSGTRAAARIVAVFGGLALVTTSAAAAGPGAGYHAKADALRRQSSVLASHAHSALLDLYALDAQLRTAQSRLDLARANAALLRTREQRLAQELAATQATLRASRASLALNLRTLYVQNESSNVLAVVLGSTSLDAAVTRLDDLTRVADQSRQILATSTAARTRLLQLRVTLATQRARVSAAVAAAQRVADRLTSAHADRLAFLTRLRGEQQLKESQIRSLETAAQHAQAKSQTLQAAAATRNANPLDPGDLASAPLPAPAPAGGHTLTVSSTGYSLPGHTASGLPVGWGIVAVDPAVIPLGTKMTIPGYGEAVAADTGSAVRGLDIDIWFPTLAQARAWGRRTVTITLH